MSVAIIDGDVFVFRCGFAGEKTKYLVETADDFIGFDTAKEANVCLKEYPGRLWSRKEYEPVENVLQIVKSSLQQVLDELGATSYRLYLSGRSNFRNNVYPEYKSNRDGMVRPKHYGAIRDYLVGVWDGRNVDGYEADDAVGIDALATPSSVIVSVDKDLDQIPTEHYNWVTKTRYRVTPQDGMTFFYQQMLTGDATDNIPGIDGIGPVKAKAALAECKSPPDMARVVFELYGGDRTTIDRNAKLLWIWRKPNDEHPFFRHLDSSGKGV